MPKGTFKQRAVALGSYFVAAFLFLGFLSPLGDGGLAGIIAFFYVPLSVLACVGAFCLPLAYYTVLKAVGLAGLGALLPALIVCGPYYITRMFPAG